MCPLPGSGFAAEIGLGFGLALAGIPLSFIAKGVGHAKFYSDPTTSFGDKVEAAFDNPEPPSEGFGL